MRVICLLLLAAAAAGAAAAAADAAAPALPPPQLIEYVGEAGVPRELFKVYKAEDPHVKTFRARGDRKGIRVIEGRE
jgi:hypothetical protein